ncbi:unnamed protein product [Urochloa decumbens]|uniref:AP2/ERF domain-containing protein n=1 Tax=Urochloa decumbens TaxID=240449 RepID=A0ABC9BV67_9POAL
MAAAAGQGRSELTGVRFRQRGGRWAAEIRVPCTRDKVWVGAFDTDREAALAYDALLFCFYGENLPRNRRFNFPTVPRPDIPEDVRAHLNTANIKDIAKKHALGLRANPLPPPPAAATAGPSANAGGNGPAAIYHGRNPNEMDIDLNQ